MLVLLLVNVNCYFIHNENTIRILHYFRTCFPDVFLYKYDNNIIFSTKTEQNR